MADKPGLSNQTSEMTESTASSNLNSSTELPPSSASSVIHRKPSISSIPKKAFNSQASSNTNSPKPSREPSPARPTARPSTSTSARTGAGRSRKNSSQDPSPSRSSSAQTPNVPSSAAIQRALSSANTPVLKPQGSETSVFAPTPQKITTTNHDIKEPPRWPISPRLRSPPPMNRPNSTARRPDQDLPPIGVLRLSQTESAQPILDSGEESPGLSGMRTPGRGVSGTGSTLETVQEISQPGTPAFGFDGPSDRMDAALEENAIDQAFKASKLKSKSGDVSGSESGERKGEIKLRPTASANALARPTTKPSVATTSVRSKASEGSTTKNMTVETETVSSIPQVAVGGGTLGPGGNGSLRAKPSSETIRPKKERKKPARKVPQVNSGVESSRSTVHQSRGASTPQKEEFHPSSSRNLMDVSYLLMGIPRVASSKADIFEAKIASAVDEANSSDSEETFVYESNPPDAERPRRYHSRTPSATSMASQLDQRKQGDGHSVQMKKSMKFANSFVPPENGLMDDDGSGTGRSAMGTGRGTVRHHHIGRWGRNGGNGHASLFDNESPFPNVSKSSKFGNNNPRQSSRPTSPRASNGKFGYKKNSPISSGYDIDDGAGADDERTPLVSSSLRSVRGSRHRRPPTARQLEHQSRRNPSMLTRFAGCLVLSIMVLLVMSGAIGFLFATTQPLTEVKILALKKVLASQEELMLEMEVMARNPNVMAVSIDSLDISVFAKSKHAGQDNDWWSWPPDKAKTMRQRGLRIGDTKDEGAQTRDDSPWDPPFGDPDDPDERPLMLLGRISHFDNPLTFEGSPFRHQHEISTGEIRLAKPGNETQDGGTERWEKILKYEFDLILQGVLKYQLPLSQRVRSVVVTGKVTVKPNQEPNVPEGDKDGDGGKDEKKSKKKI